MKALTISQPWASLIADGQKFVENRKWSTNYRGEIAIHAGQGTQYLSKPELAKYPTGCVIATARLIECVSLSWIKDTVANSLNVRTSSEWITWQEVLDHDYTEGPYCWVLDDIRRIEPVPAKGKQGLWEWSQPIQTGQ